MSKYDKDWLHLDNDLRLKRSNIVGYHKNANENYTKIFMVGLNGNGWFPANESPEELDVMLGKTVSTTTEEIES